MPVCSQTWFAKAAPDAPEAASVLFTASFQATFALGALTGGAGLDHLSVSAVMLLGGATAALVVAVVAATGTGTGPGRFRVGGGGGEPRWCTKPGGENPTTARSAGTPLNSGDCFTASFAC